MCVCAYVRVCRKLLSGDTPSASDLEGVDFSLVRSLEMLRNIRSDPDVFATTFFETFTTASSNDRVVELLPGGAQKDVTYETRAHYCDLVTQVRLFYFILFYFILFYFILF